MLTSCGLFGAMFVVNSNQPEEGCWLLLRPTAHMRVKDYSNAQRSHSSPHSAAPLTHRPRNTAAIFKSHSTLTKFTEIQRTGRGKPLQSESIWQSTENLMLRAESPAVTLSHWNLTVKNYLVRQLWVWQGRAGVCRGTADPRPISPPPQQHSLFVSNHFLLPFVSIQTQIRCFSLIFPFHVSYRQKQ